MSATRVLDLAWLIPLLPLVGAIVLLLVGKRIGEPASGFVATALIALAFVWACMSIVALHSLDADQREHLTQGFTWFQSGGFHVDIRFLVDPLSSTMILFVTGVGSLIHLYAIGYMHGDARFSRFFAYLNLFTASMLVLILGSSYLVTFLGWEGVGLCSYLLISFWFERPSAAVAGKKAFVTNRVGDFGFMIAMFLIFEKAGTLNYTGPHNVFSQLEAFGTKNSAVVTAVALLLFVGAVGKSAQLPLHIWLPDAMEGPTPVSALIHAATMVTAGVYLMVRSNAFLHLSSHAATVIAWVGVITAFYAATVALVNNDIKRVLAYSTISQLGYMFLAVGVGAYSAAIFHMVTHAFFKALLFLGAGSVMHGLNDEQDMRFMGRLRPWMPITAFTFIIGWLTIAGIFPFAGFWSKDEILAETWIQHDYALWAIGAITALLTAFYMTRQVYLVFFGNARWRPADEVGQPYPLPVVAGGSDDDAAPGGTATAVAHESGDHEDTPHGIHPHESNFLMTLPLAVLAMLSIVGGIINLPFVNLKLDFLTEWLEPVVGPAHEPNSFLQGFTLSLVALVIAVVGIGVGVAIYRRGIPDPGADPVPRKLGPFGTLFGHAWYIDEGVGAFVAGPGRKVFDFFAHVIDQLVIDGAVNGIAHLVKLGGNGLRRVQSGFVRNYALAIVIGAALLLLYFGLRAA